nr:MAG TPA: hypothetical protein [Caudoviricetes sp.]
MSDCLIICLLPLYFSNGCKVAKYFAIKKTADYRLLTYKDKRTRIDL